jgi:hypothetical protein
MILIIWFVPRILSHGMRKILTFTFYQREFYRNEPRIGNQPMMFESPKFESIDIDTPDDWNFALVASQYLLGLRGNPS